MDAWSKRTVDEVWRGDIYSLRKYSPGDIDCFLDIGACLGSASVLFKAIDPFARVIAIEPCKMDYEYLRTLVTLWKIECYNMALGDGTPLCFDYRERGRHRFYTKDEKWWIENPEYLVESQTLPSLFKRFKIKGRYIIKVDCEGGERFLLRNKQTIEIVKGAVQFNIEIHRGFGFSIEQWIEWFDSFKDTHTFYKKEKAYNNKGQFEYREVNKPITSKLEEYMLVKK